MVAYAIAVVLVFGFFGTMGYGMLWELSPKLRAFDRRVRAKIRPAKYPPIKPYVFVDWYGDHHKEEREKYAATIREDGGLCMERVCVMPTRRIRPGAYWHLAHDHVRGGATDYLGPAHPECNEHEARERGVKWDS